MDNTGSTSHITLRTSSIGYLESDNWTRFEDVQIMSFDGDKFGFNRCMLASLSWLCKKLFMDLYDCPVANLDEQIYISSNFSSAELTSLRDFFLSGRPPEQSQASLYALGVDFSNLKYTFPTGGEDWVSKEEVQYDEDDSLEVKLETDQYSEDFQMSDENVEEVVRKPRKSKKKVKVKKKTVAPAVPKNNEKKMSAKELLFYFPDPATHPRDLSKAYQCPKCSRGFSKPVDYRQHIHRHELGRPDYSRAYFCDHCEKFEARTTQELSKHIRDECTANHQHDDTSSKFQYWCGICPDGPYFNTSWQLLGHHKDIHKGFTFGGGGGGAGLIDKDNMCPACGTKFLNPDSVRKHMETEGKFHKDAKCNFCDATFLTWNEHKEHNEKFHNGVIKYPCHHCGLNLFDTANEQRNHMTLCRIHPATRELEKYDEKHIACTICERKVIATTGKTRAHLTDFHAELGQSCKICPSVPLFFTEKSLSIHMYTLHKNRHQCDMCPKSFPNLYRLRDHKITHTTEKKIPCELCGACFLRESDLTKHITGTHQGRNKQRLREETRTKICEVCGKELRWGQQYRNHMKYQHGDKDVVCQEEGCGYKSSEMAMRDHIRAVHTFKKCSDCGKDIKYSNLKYHKLVHHTSDSDKPFQCTVCMKGFVTKAVLKDHMNIHSGDRPYQCKFCSKATANSANCNKHMRESHPEEYKALLLERKAKATTKSKGVYNRPNPNLVQS